MRARVCVPYHHHHIPHHLTTSPSPSPPHHLSFPITTSPPLLPITTSPPLLPITCSLLSHTARLTHCRPVLSICFGRANTNPLRDDSCDRQRKGAAACAVQPLHPYSLLVPPCWRSLCFEPRRVNGRTWRRRPRGAHTHSAHLPVCVHSALQCRSDRCATVVCVLLQAMTNRAYSARRVTIRCYS